MAASRLVAIESLDRAIECAEENMIPQLAECLSWNNDYDGECYMVLAEYGNLLDASTRRKIVEGVFYLPAFMFIRFLYILPLCSIDNVFKYCY